MINLLLASVLAPPVIQFRIETNGDQFLQKGIIHAKFLVKNVSQRPVVIAKAIWDGSPAATAGIDLFKGNHEVQTSNDSSIRPAQVMVNSEVSEDRFITLKPNEETIIYWVKMKSALNFHGLPPNLKSSWSSVTEEPFSSGQYELIAKYEFEPDSLKKSWKMDWNREITFKTPKAKQLFNSAIKGNFRTNKSITVVSW